MVICDICVSESELKSKGAIQRPFMSWMLQSTETRVVITQSVRPFVHHRLEQGLITLSDPKFRATYPCGSHHHFKHAYLFANVRSILQLDLSLPFRN